MRTPVDYQVNTEFRLYVEDGVWYTYDEITRCIQNLVESRPWYDGDSNDVVWQRIYCMWPMIDGVNRFGPWRDFSQGTYYIVCVAVDHLLDNRCHAYTRYAADLSQQLRRNPPVGCSRIRTRISFEASLDS